MIDYVSIVFQFLAGINFTLLYFVLFKGRVQLLLKSSEFKTYIGLVIGATLWIGYLLMTRNGYGLEHAFRSALFHVVSFITTTGVFNDDASRWPHITWVILGGLMFIGACSGSTTGGFKCVRGVMVFKVLRNEFRKILHPNAVLPVKIDGQTVPQQKMNSLLAFFAFYVMIVLLSTTIMLLADIDITNSIVIALSLISNVGLSLSTEIGEVMSWADLPIYLKWTCSFLMLVGRLEIMSVFVLFTRAFWKDS
jgi:trk system potassium uptake protein TrkH